MHDLLTLKERISVGISVGESHFREFKTALEGPPSAKKPRETRAIAKDIGEALVGFANADGGELLIGVEDDGTITGVPHTPDQIVTLLLAPKSNVHVETPLQGALALKIDFDGRAVLYFQISKSTEFIHVTSDGRCLQRRDMQTTPVPSERLHFERQEQISREYDRQFVDGASISDLDLDQIHKVSDVAAKGMSPEKFLQLMGLGELGLGTLRLRRAALVLFAKDVTRWHPRCGVRIVRVRGTELKTGHDYNATPGEVVSGNIFTLLPLAWERLRPFLVQTKFSAGSLFTEQVMYPEDACREALINAIAHRDYSIEGKNIEIFIYDDRMEVNSPGALLSTIKLEDLKKLQGVHQSRNAVIARVLREFGYMREMGEGIRRIFNLMSSYDLVAPDLVADQNHFSIVLRHKSVYSQADQQWLNAFAFLKLTKDEMRIALLGKNGDLISPQHILDTLQLTDPDDYRAILESLKFKGVIYRAVAHNEIKRNWRPEQKKRQVPRYAVRQPEECERNLEELGNALQQIGAVERVSRPLVQKVFQSLPKSNHYRSLDALQLERALRSLGFTLEGGRPSDVLRRLWDAAKPAAPQTDRQKSIATEVAAAAEAVQSSGVVDIFVGNIPSRATYEDVYALFTPFGAVRNVFVPRVQRDPDRVYAFVTMQTASAAAAAVEGLQRAQIHGVRLDVKWSMRKSRS